MIKQVGFETIIADDENHEKLHCEIYHDGKLIGLISQENAPNKFYFEIEQSKFNSLDAEEFIEILQIALKRLKGEIIKINQHLFRGKLRNSNLPTNDNYRLRIIDANGRVSGVSGRVAGTTVTTTVPATSNKISAVGSASYAYDLAGDITSDGAKTYTWNAAGRLATVKVGASTVGTYTYDYLGRRAKKVAGSTTTLYVYGPNGELYGEYTSAGALVKEYVTLNDVPLAQIAAGSPETLTYIHTDHLGTPRYATNTAGASVWAWPTDAFGISAPTGTATINLRFPGQYADAESGLFYNWNRYYKPTIGRYLSPDPIGIDGGLNTFSYVGQSPVMGSDPLGLASNYISINDIYTETGPLGLLGGVIMLPASLIEEAFGLGRAATVNSSALIPKSSFEGQICEPATTIVRTTRSGETAVQQIRPDGSVIDISPQRVKEFVPNTHPNAPPGTLQRVKFSDALPNSKGFKRAPTVEELEFLRSLK